MLTIGLTLAFAALALACGNPIAKVREAAERQRQMNDLKELGLAIHNFHDSMGRTPKSIDELEQSGYLSAPNVASLIRGGQITAIWGFKLQPAYQHVIAYRAGDNGNMLVLFGDGSVRPEPQATFPTLTKAAPAPDKPTNQPPEDKP